jgi:hypothetical protein
MPTACFAGYFGDRVLLFAPDILDTILFTLPAVAVMIAMCHGAQLFSVKMVSYELFCLNWPGTIILPISASHVAWDDRHPYYSQLLLLLGPALNCKPLDSRCEPHLAR